MQKSNIKLIIADCDGTILNDQKNIDSDLKKTITDLSKQNIIFTLASGRNEGLIERYIDELEISYPYITDNGGNIYKLHKCIHTNVIPGAYCNEITRYLCDKEIPFSIFGGKGGYRYLDSDFFKERVKHFKNSNIVSYDKNHDFTNENCFKITFDAINHQEQINKIVEYLNNKYSSLICQLSEDTTYVITLKRGTKGEGVKKIAQLLNIKLDDVMVFGDNYNDITMFENAAVSIAMANSKIEVKERAKYVCLDNNHNGVSTFLKKYFDLKE